MLHLQTNLGIQGIKRVVTHEPLTSLHKLIVIVFEKGVPRTEIWRALYGVASFRRAEGKWVVAVDEDIDPDNSDATFWAMSYRCKPHRDVKILEHKHEGHGPRSMIDSEDSAVLIDATLKETFPPISLPKREYMEKRAGRSGRRWACRSCARSRPGSATTSASGTITSSARRSSRSSREYWQTGEWCRQRKRSRRRDEHRDAHARRRSRLRQGARRAGQEDSRIAEALRSRASGHDGSEHLLAGHPRLDAGALAHVEAALVDLDVVARDRQRIDTARKLELKHD